MSRLLPSIDLPKPETRNGGNVYRWEREIKLPLSGRKIHFGIYRYESTLAFGWRLFFNLPWNYGLMLLFGIVMVMLFANQHWYRFAFEKIFPGFWVTIPIPLYSYGIALLIAIFIGTLRAYPPQPGHGLFSGFFHLLRLGLHHILTFYVDFFRGIPTLILLLFFAFGFIPSMKGQFDWFTMSSRSLLAAIIPLSLAYGAFMSETVRAGIRSVGTGQLEAARSLGMRPLLIMRNIVLPQALRVVTPPLGNDFIAIIKDSALVSVLGMNDLTQLAKINASSNFRFFEFYTILALFYLALTIFATMIVRYMDHLQRAYYYFIAFLLLFCFILYPFRFPLVEFLNQILGTQIEAR